MKTSPQTTHAINANATQCHHCGEACSHAHIHEDGYSFCCEGCKSVYQILRDNNLCTYYDLNDHAGISFKNLHNIKQRSRFDYLNDTNVAAKLLEFSSETLARVSFHLPQIHCTSCLWLLEKLHKLNDGVISSRVDFMQKNVAIAFQPQQLSLRNLVELLTTLGYEPELHLQNLTSAKSTMPQKAHQTSQYLKIGIAGFAVANTMIFSFPEYLAVGGELSEPLRRLFGYASIALALPVLFYSASDFFRSAWQSIAQKRVNLDVPIILGILALFVRSVVEIAHGSTSGYLDSFSGLVFLLLIGRLFQQKTFDTISFDRDYTSYFPIAVAVKKSGNETTIPLSELNIGERLIIRNKELIPTDSILKSSVGHIDYSFVTGESAPVEVVQGSRVYAGGRVLGTTLEMVSAKEVSQSYLTSLWNNEAFKKHEKNALENVADRFGAYFTAFTLALAAIAFFAWLPHWETALNAATAVLVVACPCAMTLAAPFALGWTLKIFGKAGFYLKNTSVVLDLSRINAMVFDKTGTLTTSQKSAVRYSGKRLSTEEQELCALALHHSQHPLARGIVQAFSYINPSENFVVENVLEVPSRGVSCMVAGRGVALGTAEFIEEHCSHELLFCEAVRSKQLGQSAQNRTKSGSSVHCSIDGEYKGEFLVQSEYRSGLKNLFDNLRQKADVFLLSGDNDREKERLADLFPNERTMRFYQTPHDKLEAVRDLQASGAHVMMIGDGLNDAGALKQSDVGIALAEETALFSPACDAVLASEQLHRLHDFISFSRLAKRIIIGAFWISVVYNVVGLTFAVMGWLSPLVSAILMPISNATVVGFSTGAVQLAAKWRKI
ncbi:MAG: HAD family hydrolase [Candidatus Kapaibacterium sp.]|nr:MAG: HAD family hydrolase [Candidatus Kapabacteria bacterium]